MAQSDCFLLWYLILLDACLYFLHLGFVRYYYNHAGELHLSEFLFISVKNMPDQKNHDIKYKIQTVD